jgi:hypothetical protein
VAAAPATSLAIHTDVHAGRATMFAFLTKGNRTMKLGHFVPLFPGGTALIAGAPR